MFIRPVSITKQEIYDKEVANVFNHLDMVEQILAKNKESFNSFLIGNKLTEADIRLFTTIVRFDAVYVQHFKCNLKMIRYDYPNIHKWLRFLYWKIPGFEKNIPGFRSYQIPLHQISSWYKS